MIRHQLRQPAIIILLLVLVAMVASCGRADTGSESGVTELMIPTLQTPSLGYFLSPIIESQGFDEDHDLAITFQQKPASTFRTDFAAGTSKIGGSGTLLTDVALVQQKGVDTVYLFNVFDYWGAIVTPSQSNIQGLADLEGRTLGAALPTANFAMYKFIAEAEGVDLSSIETQGADTPGLGAMARSERVDATQLWEPAYSILAHDNDDFKTIDLADRWGAAHEQRVIPYLGVAAHRSWVEENKEIIPQLYATYRDAANYVEKNPVDASELISEETDIDSAILEDLIKSERLALNVYPANEQRSAINEVFKAAVKNGYLEKMPPESVIYEGPVKP